MARYRKIDTRMWADAKFRALSSPLPSGKYLWIALLTGPYTTNLPGLSRVGEMALAEELGWTLEGFRKGFAELFREGLAKADWNARVVWVPNAIKYNPPDNPNVVKGWRDSWDEIPECALKGEAYQRFKEFTKGLGEGFAKAFVECCAQGLANQEQEQEQLINTTSEPETGSDPTDSPSQKKPSSLPSHQANKLASLLKSELLRNKPDSRILSAHERRWAVTAQRMLDHDGRSYDQIEKLIRWVQNDEFELKNVRSMEKLRERFDQLELKAGAKGTKHAPVAPLPASYVPASERTRQELLERRAGGML